MLPSTLTSALISEIGIDLSISSRLFYRLYIRMYLAYNGEFANGLPSSRAGALEPGLSPWVPPQSLTGEKESGAADYLHITQRSAAARSIGIFRSSAPSAASRREKQFTLPSGLRITFVYARAPFPTVNRRDNEIPDDCWALIGRDQFFFFFLFTRRSYLRDKVTLLDAVGRKSLKNRDGIIATFPDFAE